MRPSLESMETKITSLRLKAAGDMSGNTDRTILATDKRELLWREHGVEVVEGDIRTLVPWPSIGSFKFEVVGPKQSNLTQPAPEPPSADPRPGRASKRARAKARTTSRS